MRTSSPSFRLINQRNNASFISKFDHLDISLQWHYHPEIEMVHILKGNVTGLVGDTFREFDAGDLVVIGANIPHVFMESTEYIKALPSAKPFVQVIQFSHSFLGEEFMMKPEFRQIGLMLKRAKRGLYFPKPELKKMSTVLMEINTPNDTQNILNLLQLLCALAGSRKFHYIANQDYHFDYNQDEERMRNIKEYIYSHFQEKITLTQVATEANMTENSFCRYFKGRTLKSFTRFLNEVRITYACKLLEKNNYNISEACFESGYNNLSYFDRQFKQIMKLSPKEYRKKKESTSQLA